MNMNLDFYLPDATNQVPAPNKNLRHVFVVPECECGLLYRHGKFLNTLPTGRHVRWGRGYALTRADLRSQMLLVPGQEVLSAEHVALKISVAVTFRLVDAAKAYHAAQDWRGNLYHATQQALRGLVAAQPFEALLAQRLNLGQQILAAVQPAVANLGIEVQSADLKDVIFPGDLKKAFAEVLKARQEGQAALERARGESAALRNLANAARLLENNPALQNLRLLQSLGQPGQTLVLGLPTGLAPLPVGTNKATGRDASDAKGTEHGD